MTSNYALPAHEPTWAVKTMHGFTGADDKFNWEDEKDHLLRLGIIAGAAGLLVIMLYLLFLCGHCCRATRKCCCCFYEKMCCKGRPKVGKMVVALLFIVVAAVMTASIFGRNEFHKGVDSLYKSKALAGSKFAELADIAGTKGPPVDQGMVVQATRYAEAANALAGSSGDPCQCAGADCNEAWADAALNEYNNKIKEITSSQLKEPTRSFKSSTESLELSFKDANSAIGKDLLPLTKDDLKKYIDYGLFVCVALAWLVCFFSIVSTLCLSKGRGCLCGLQWSTVFWRFTNLFAFIFLLLMLALVVSQVLVGGLVADICYQNPEQNLLTLMKEEANIENNVVDYYMTCVPPDPLKPSFDSAATAFGNIEDSLNTLDDATRKAYAEASCAKSGLSAACATNNKCIVTGLQCRALPDERADPSPTLEFKCPAMTDLQNTVPLSKASVTTHLRGALACKDINAIFTELTRNAMCKHLVTGTLYLWTVQAATAVLMILSMVLFTLFAQSFKAAREDIAVSQSDIARTLELELAKAQNQVQHAPPSREDNDVYV